MRLPLLAAALATVLALSIPGAAQDDCSDPADACPWVVSVSAVGFDQTRWTLTQDEYYELTIYNLDDKAHRITIAGYNVDLTVPADGEDSIVLLLHQAGNFTVQDVTSGRSGTLTVVAGDFVDETSTGTRAGTKASPAVPLAALVGCLALAATASRRP